MPIYECRCIPCEMTFEVLARAGHANRRHPCPECGRPSRRIASTFAIVAGGSNVRDAKSGTAAANAVAPKRRSGPPLCLQNPHIPLLCHMDQKSGERFIAHFNGRGDEYDDKMASREDLRKKRGLPPPPALPPSGHRHEARRDSPIAGAGAHASSHDDGDSHSHNRGKARSHSHAGSHAHPH
jgi:putative FmdB family regulatory protein